jgi:phosphoribosylformylglycinamidine synthase subunit PurL
MVGVIDDVGHITRSAFRASGDAVVLLGRNTEELGGSEYLKVIHGTRRRRCSRARPGARAPASAGAAGGDPGGGLRSAHDVAEGGLAVALAESCIGDGAAPLGLNARLEDTLDSAPLLFGEGQSRVVISCAAQAVERVLQHFSAAGVEAKRIGTVGAMGGDFVIDTPAARVEAPVEQLSRIYFSAIPRRMDGTPEVVDAMLHSEVSLP